MKKANKNDVIQVNEKNGKYSKWCGCLMIVSEVKNWGVLAGLLIPFQGTAYLRINHGDYDVIGPAALVPQET